MHIEINNKQYMHDFSLISISNPRNIYDIFVKYHRDPGWYKGEFSCKVMVLDGRICMQESFLFCFHLDASNGRI